MKAELEEGSTQTGYISVAGEVSAVKGGRTLDCSESVMSISNGQTDRVTDQ